MRQAPFAQFTCVGIDVSNLLEARMIITTYNQHVRLLSSEPFGWLVCASKVFSGLGADIVYGIIALKMPRAGLLSVTPCLQYLHTLSRCRPLDPICLIQIL